MASTKYQSAYTGAKIDEAVKQALAIKSGGYVVSASVSDDEKTLTIVGSDGSTKTFSVNAETYEALNAIRYGRISATYTGFWNWPHVVVSHTEAGNHAYFGYVSTDGITGVGDYDLDTGVMTGTDIIESFRDDHDDCTVAILGGTLYAFTFKHAKENVIRQYKCITGANGNYFELVNTITCSAASTYVQVFEYADKYYLFSRIGTHYWREFIYDGSSWSEAGIVVYADSQYYCLFRPTTTEGRLAIAMYANPHMETDTGGSSDTSIRLGFIDLADGKIRSYTTNAVLGTVGDGVIYTDFKMASGAAFIPEYSGGGNRLYDLAVAPTGTHCVIWGTWGDGETSEYFLRYAGLDYSLGSGLAVYKGNYDLLDGAFFCGPVGSEEIKFYVAIKTAETEKSKLILGTFNISSKTITWSDTIDTAPTTGWYSRIMRPVTDADGTVLIYQRGAVATAGDTANDIPMNYNFEIKALEI